MQLLFYFFVYSFGGWLLENTYNYNKTRIFLKDNFLKLPLKPMYGLTPVLLIILTKPHSHWIYVSILYFLIPTIVEYVTGTLLEKYTGHKWWNYEELPFHYKGHICLRFSLYWGLLTLTVLTIIQPVLFQFYLLAPTLCNIITIVLFILFIMDLSFTLILTFVIFYYVRDKDIV